MNFFQPKHNNCIFRTCGESILITSNGNLIVSNLIKNYFLLNEIDEVDEDEYESGNIHSKYEILYDGNMITYDDLMLIDNAISVCKSNHSYHILLSNFKIIHMYHNIYKSQILELDRICRSIQVEYINSMNSTIVLYSNDKLYTVNISYKLDNSYKLEVYDNVIGYALNANILLMLSDEYKMACISKLTLYKVENDNKIPINSNDILGCVDLNELTCMSIQMNRIYTVINGNVHFWITEQVNYYYYDILKFNNTLHIDLIDSIYFCMLDDNRLIIRGHDKSYTLETYLNVTRYLLCACYTILFHFDDSLTIFNFTVSKEKREIVPIKNPVLHSFLINPECRYFIDKIHIVLHYKKFNEKYYLVYINTENFIEILDIVNLEFVDLNTFLNIHTNIKRLNLIEYNTRNYI